MKLFYKIEKPQNQSKCETWKLNSKFNVTSCQTLFQEHNSWKHRVSSRKSVIASRTCWTWDTKMSNLRKIYHYFQQGKNCTIWVSFYWKSTMINMAIRVVEFSNGGTKFERFLPKEQHTQRKWLNFVNWINGGLGKFKKSEF